METNMIATDSVQYIVVKIGTEQYGIDIKYVENIVRMQKITRVPKVQSYVKGVINLRGEVIAVMSIRCKMGLPEDEFTNKSRIIILKPDQQSEVGIIVDEVKEVVTLEADEIEKTFYDVKDERVSYINGIGKHNGELISLLDMNIIMSDREKE